MDVIKEKSRECFCCKRTYTGSCTGKEDTGENMKGPYDRCPAYIFVDNEADCNGDDNLFNQIKYEEAKLVGTTVSHPC